uniref:TIL domain-containing protein n=1 Tax=Caenorhabditis tropicalis TaxID=1561998 RepID=A0A1I7TS69_9PELO
MFQSFSQCACEATCNNPNPICSSCEPGCTCRNGFVRSSLRLCVLPEECPRTKLRRFELKPPRKLYEAVPVVLTSTTTEEPTTVLTTEETTTLITTKASIIEEMVTVPLIVLRNGPTPPSAPPMLQEPISDMIGAPSATPPPDFSYGPPGMNAAKVALYENFLKQKRIMRALRHRRNQFAERML